MQDDTAKRWDDSLISLGLGALVVVVSGILIYNYFSGQTPRILQEQMQTLASPTVIAQAQQTADPAAAQVTPIAFSSRPSNEVIAPATPKPVVTTQPTIQPTVAPTAVPTQIAQATVAPTQVPVPTMVAAPVQTTAPVAAAVAPKADTKTLPASYTVASGDTLWDLSAKFYGTGFEWKKIAQANNLSNARELAVGANISIPRNEMISATSTETPGKTQVAQTSPAPVAQVSPAPNAQPGSTVGALPNAVQQGMGVITHTVVKGETLWSIAGTKCNNNYVWSSIAKQNKLVAPGVIHTGNTLTFSCQ